MAVYALVPTCQSPPRARLCFHDVRQGIALGVVAHVRIARGNHLVAMMVSCHGFAATAVMSDMTCLTCVYSSNE